VVVPHTRKGGILGRPLINKKKLKENTKKITLSNSHTLPKIIHKKP
jgi:hypothetical protein